MKVSFQKYIAPVALALAPLATFAQTRGVVEILQSVSGLLNIIITFLILLATVLFLWGIVKYIMAGGDEEKLKEARNTIIYGIIFLAVMIAVWGFVNIVLDFVFGSGAGREAIPSGPQQGTVTP